MLVLKQRKLCVNAVAFSPDGTRLAAARLKGIFQMWELPAGKLRVVDDAVEPAPASVGDVVVAGCVEDRGAEANPVGRVRQLQSGQGGADVHRP